MIYRERKSLTVLELTEERDTLSYDELIPLLMRQPSNVIYIEFCGKLYGIVTTGRIGRTYRDGKRQVKINTNFIAVPNEANAYMYSRRCFNEKQNIEFVPVVDSEGTLLGEYQKWDDDLILRRSSIFSDLPQVFSVPRSQRIALVKPCAMLENRRRLFSYWKEFLEKEVSSLRIIEAQDIPDYLDNVDFILFVDAMEMKGLTALYKYMLDHSFLGLTSAHILTCGAFFSECDLNVQFSLKSIQAQGVAFLPFGFFENKDSYLEKFRKQIREKYSRRGLRELTPLPIEMQKEFFCECYEKYAEQRAGIASALSDASMPHLFLPDVGVTKDGFLALRDVDTPFVHVLHGQRKTVGQPEKYERCIYMCGPCTIMGIYVEDLYTVASLLQSELNQSGFSCKVVNLGICGTIGNHNLQMSQILKEKLKQGDIVVFDTGKYDNEVLLTSKTQTLNMVDVLEEHQVPAEWFWDLPRHYNHKVNQILAKKIFEKLLPVLYTHPTSRKTIEKDNNVVKLLYIEPYFSDFDKSKYKKIGSIVMNCNPFTFGHRYLIEYAASQVDFLIIFVVKEDESLFTFEERYAMVYDGTSDLENIKVVPGGDFILTKRVFPEYFVKETDRDIVQNTENDITIFAEKIAPVLGITHRFVGEELNDRVTDIYNQAMKKILPAHNIQLVEIPREQHKGTAISASRVRQSLDENDLAGLDGLVPESTKQILFRTEK